MIFKRMLLASIMMLFSAMSVLAAVGPTLDLGTVSGAPGQTVAVPITLTNNGAALSSVAVDIEYDAAVLTPTAVAPATKPVVIGAAGTAAGKMITQNLVSDGLYRIGLTSLADTNAIGDGVVATITFAVAAGTSGNVPLANRPSASDANGVAVAITGSNGQISLPVVLPTVTAFTIPATGTSLTSTFTTLTASANTTAYLISETSTKPLVGDSRWSLTKPASYTFTSYGAKTLYAWVKDKDGNISAAAATATTTLTEPAATVVAFTIPATGYSTTVSITTFTGSANAVAYLITESATAPAASDAGWKNAAPATFAVTGLTAHTLYAWVKNTSGAVSASKTATITLSEKPAPVLVVNTLADNDVTNNNTLNITGSVTKNSAAGSGDISGLTVNGNNVPLNQDGTFSTAVTLTEGSNNIVTVASDNQNPPVTATDSRTIIYDKTAPTLTISAPANNSQTNVASVTITGTVNETSTVSVSQNAGASEFATMTGTSFSFAATLVEGDNTFDLTAKDQAENSSSVTQLKIKLDTASPTLAITDPSKDITTTLRTYLLTGTAGDNNEVASLDIKVDGVSVTPAAAVVNGAFQKEITLSNPSTKTWPVSVTVTDAVGNSTTVTRNIIFKALGLADALKALRISVGLDDETAADQVLDVAPLLNDKPNGDGSINAGDAGVILRKVAGFESW
ncbi:MAG: cohesin domain-containing protein [Desulfuromonadaceae bacterium]|nr:cohesin domain-containing protein [Desulfuromonadaceae bacterium]MDD2854669.1 cohesin domain-containing protein [Desulfuromonadaceae bacterium]